MGMNDEAHAFQLLYNNAQRERTRSLLPADEGGESGRGEMFAFGGGT